MIPLITSISLPKYSLKINPNDHLLFCGSCFAETLGSFWCDHQLIGQVNPGGILFNPVSIANYWNLVLNQNYSEIDYRLVQNQWVSLHFHSKFNAQSKDLLQEKIEKMLRATKDEVTHCRYLIITWGTAFAWIHKELKMIVANCHRLPSYSFERQLISMDDLVLQSQRVIIQLLNLNPSLKIILTVSPIRHLRQLGNENSLSKAHLLIAANKLVTLFPEHIMYFPAYEIMMDELRDYRFYAEDLIHPSKLAQQIIRERFMEGFASSSLKDYLLQSQKLYLQEQHHPLYLNEEQKYDYFQNLQKKRQELLQSFSL